MFLLAGKLKKFWFNFICGIGRLWTGEEIVGFLGYCAGCSWDPIFSHSGTIRACDGRTQDHSIYCNSIVLLGINLKLLLL